jgi:hypothetical protein
MQQEHQISEVTDVAAAEDAFVCPSKCVLFCGVPYWLHGEQLVDLFGVYGTITDIKVFWDPGYESLPNVCGRVAFLNKVRLWQSSSRCCCLLCLKTLPFDTCRRKQP